MQIIRVLLTQRKADAKRQRVFHLDFEKEKFG